MICYYDKDKNDKNDEEDIGFMRRACFMLGGRFVRGEQTFRGAEGGVQL